LILAFILELDRWGLNHPLTGNGYQSWSGIISDLGEITLVGSVVMGGITAYRHIECHQEGCHRLGRFQHGHFKLCHVHHPHVPNDGRINRKHIDGITERKAKEAGL
jgi:hypothetical protein